MYRFFVPEENIREKEVQITGDDVNHIKNVLRMQPGEKVVVSCGRGTDYFCVIRDIKEEAILLAITEKKAAVTELPVRITLFQALPKRDKLEFVIQKAVELGAAEIVPFRAKRCVVKLDEKKEEKKRLRWQTIAEAAAKQSGRGRVPEIRETMDFSQALDYGKSMNTMLIPYELCEDMTGSVEAMKQAVQGNSIAVFIGPEGGFERGEVEQAVSEGARPISLGKRILRTETAGMAVLSVLMFLIEGR
ncbi:MAG: 16S rRNA (uracil(1498)-N(3))-methyltransferase [Lachnospiraceae bacterium]|nr:16S rRNA (uracil(1498)-N(3))-methyltransferase [Lachnospiraceae bacterium]